MAIYILRSLNVTYNFFIRFLIELCFEYIHVSNCFFHFLVHFFDFVSKLFHLVFGGFCQYGCSFFNYLIFDFLNFYFELGWLNDDGRRFLGFLGDWDRLFDFFWRNIHCLKLFYFLRVLPDMLRSFVNYRRTHARWFYTLCLKSATRWVNLVIHYNIIKNSKFIQPFFFKVLV